MPDELTPFGGDFMSEKSGEDASDADMVTKREFVGGGARDGLVDVLSYAGSLDGNAVAYSFHACSFSSR